MQPLSGKERRVKKLKEEEGSVTVESVFIISLILIILGFALSFSFYLHDRVVLGSLTLTAGVEAESGPKGAEDFRTP